MFILQFYKFILILIIVAVCVNATQERVNSVSGNVKKSYVNMYSKCRPSPKSKSKLNYEHGDHLTGKPFVFERTHNEEGSKIFAPPNKYEIGTASINPRSNFGLGKCPRGYRRTGGFCFPTN